MAIFAFFHCKHTGTGKKQQKKTAEVLFSVNIDCKNCVKKLEAKLPFEEGVKDLKISLEDKTIWFAYLPEKTDKEKLAKAIEKLGYKAEEIVQEKQNSEMKKYFFILYLTAAVSGVLRAQDHRGGSVFMSRCAFSDLKRGRLLFKRRYYRVIILIFCVNG